MKKVLCLIIVIQFLIILFLSNPPRSQHETAIARSFNNKNEVIGKVGGGYVYAKLLDYRDFRLFSVMKDKDQIKSIGVASLTIIP